jgi:hypothetical protein
MSNEKQICGVIFIIVILIFFLTKYSGYNTGNNIPPYIEIFTADNPILEVFKETIQKGPSVFTSISLAFDKIQHYPLSELNKMKTEAKANLHHNLKNHFKYYLDNDDNKNEIMSRGENEHVVNPLQKVVEQLFMICQIKGVKKILLFTPEQQSLLYPNVVNPHVSKANFWTDPLFKFPLLQNTNYIEIIAYPGHMVYIPKDWWWTSINMEETFTTYIK